MTAFDGAHDQDMAPPLRPDRLAYGGAIDVPPGGKTISVPDERYRDRLLAWFQRFMYALLAVFVIAVVYGYFAVTP